MINLWEQKMRKYKKLSEKVNKQFEKIINR